MKYAFVMPRFGEGIIGGIEALVGSLARELSKRGDSVEVWATRAKDNRTWKDEYPPGSSIEYGVKTTRFSVKERDLEKWIPLEIKLHELGKLSLDEELTWMTESVTSPGLFAHIETHAPDFDFVFFAPYLFGTTFWGALIHPEKSLLIPCLHDEPYAYTKITQSLFRQVRGALFNADPEMWLVHEICGPVPGGVVGLGFDASDYDEPYAPYFSERFPYVVCTGRKETGKNGHILIDYFIDAKESGVIPEETKLVIMGGGSFSDLLRPEAATRSDIIDLPPVSELDKRRVIANALALVQPSVKESFSIVLMEAWLLKVPVLVHGEGAVTRFHVVESSGGLYFSSGSDLGGAIRYLLEDESRRKEFAVRGREYVEREYSWSAVLSRFDNVIQSLSENDDVRSC